MLLSSEMIIALKDTKVKYFHELKYNQFVDFSDWFVAKYLHWRGDAIGRERSQRAFARYLGLNPQQVNDWLNGKKRPEAADSINKLVDKFGGEVYDMLNIAPPAFEPTDEQLRPTAELISMFPEDMRPQVRQSINETLTAILREELDLDDAGTEVVRRLLDLLEGREAERDRKQAETKTETEK